MKSQLQTRIDGNKYIVTPSVDSKNDIKAYLLDVGFVERKGNFKSIQAKHGDKGKLVELDANELFLLLENESYGRFYRVVESEEEARSIIEALMKEKEEYGYFNNTELGNSFYLCRDIKEFRIIHSD